MRFKILLFFIPVFITAAYGQNPIGLPDIISYSRSAYNAGLQNRKMAQDKNGILYFANSEGLLVFDGTFWKLYPLPNKTPVRSVAIGSDNVIYAGGQNELGYFKPDKYGSLAFTSLKKLIKGNANSFKDVWDITAYNNKIFFRTQSDIFEFDHQNLKIYPTASVWQYLGSCNHRLIAQDARLGLLQLTGDKWEPVNIDNHLLSFGAISSMQPLNHDSTLIASTENGLFILADRKITRLKIKGSNPFDGGRIFSMLMLDNGLIAVGTHLGGCYIIDRYGRIIQNFSRQEGLQNNTVLGLFLDKNRNIWMGLDDGIDYIAYNSAIKHIYPERLNEGVGYSAILFNRQLYIGTSNWLYRHQEQDNNKDLSNLSGDFERVQNTKGSAWGLYNIDQHLLLAHHEGAFEVKGGEAYAINRGGYWNFVPYNDSTSANILIAGSYNGLDLINYHNNTFSFLANTGLRDPARFAVVDNGITWVANPYNGIYKIDKVLSAHPSVKLYTSRNGLPSALKNRLFKIRNKMVAATGKGIYEYNSKQDKFEPSVYFKDIFGQRDLRYLKEDTKGNIWFIEEKKLGVADFTGKHPHIIYFPELNGKLVSDFENIYPLDDENIFVGAEKGFYHINYAEYKRKNISLNVLIRTVRSAGETDSLLYGGYVQNKSSNASTAFARLNDKENSLHFEYSAPAYQQQSNIEYSYLLRGFDKEWSAWSKKTEKDYTNLPDGTFTFQVKARSNLGNESAISIYTFTVLPPWYKTIWAWLLYCIVSGCILYVAYKLLKKKFRQQRYKYEEEQKRLKYLHQLEIEKSEKEIVELKNQKLQMEIDGKNSELASVAMHLLQKGELLTKLREELVHFKNAANAEMEPQELKKLIRILGNEDKIDKDWEQFAVHFDTINSNFLKAIKRGHPGLSAHELKLCAYLKMNFSSKEIAQLTNISVRGVEISRYRLRKKLQIPTEVNLYDYFNEFNELKKEAT